MVWNGLGFVDAQEVTFAKSQRPARPENVSGPNRTFAIKFDTTTRLFKGDVRCNCVKKRSRQGQHSEALPPSPLRQREVHRKPALSGHRPVQSSGHQNVACLRSPIAGLKQETQPLGQPAVRLPISAPNGAGGSHHAAAYSSSGVSGPSRITALCSCPSQTALRVRHELRQDIAGRRRRADQTYAFACKGGCNIRISGFLSCRPF
ncbi:hypothetical protein PhaeoP18_03513 (plasmid) [Phaeobacter piscinae]|nr:hypothetical protein PhaeoP92_03690 [Phaeobacter inhibens]AUQ80324.1 hypothetical protein PhaeoP74_03691 [Phaeobacter inhibens]AUR17483.1 hypothetical protein PhaeoP70_03689 [Phaeobacter inhibens]AUR37731.1 hypothetical protein PhaeoP18_03513 [Phaeobacter piscinae]